jgi:hypothetical protein
MGEKVKKRLTKSRFLAINAKGGESISPKQKDRTTNFKNLRNEDLFGFHKCLFFNWYLVMTIFSIGTHRDKFSKIGIY